MAWFTDNPLEKMMRQRPDSGQHPVTTASTLADTHPCYGCPYGQGKPCVGVCMQNLLHKKEKGADYR